jgi:DNA-binding transcriptional regulator YhcF (GntR family)
MEFREPKAIYLQIADFVCERVLLKEWIAGERIPSVRELAIQLEVNPNTVMRTYEFLQQLGIIYNERGIGFFVDSRAVKSAMQYRKEEFMEKDMPYILNNMFLLNIAPEEMTARFEKYKKQHFS